MNNNALLSLNNISKKFPGTQALDKISFDINKGEVHALVGENGAGKSTLVKIIAGVLSRDQGEIYIDNEEINIKNTYQARKMGISVVYQELSLVPNLTVAENIYASSIDMNKFKLTKFDKIKKESMQLLKSFNINPEDLVGNLGIAAQQAVEISGALSRDSRLLIFDEPTASLNTSEIENLFNIIKILQKKSISILYISHKLEEIFEISERISVLRDGKYVGTVSTKESDKNQIVNMMVGRSLSQMFPSKNNERGKRILHVKKLSGKKFKDISFDVYKGEIVGFAGLTGAGRTELFQSIFGIGKIKSGSIYIEKEKVNIKNPLIAIDEGIGYLPEDRKQSGIFLDMSVKENTVAASLDKYSYKFLLNHQLLKEKTDHMVDQLDIKIKSTNEKLYNLSGGNQQKVLLARWLLVKPKILIVDEPTRGIDVGAKQEVYNLLKELAESGIAVILISSEMPEIIGMSDRIITMYKGKINGNISKEEVSEEKIASLIMGIDNIKSESEDNYE